MNRINKQIQTYCTAILLLFCLTLSAQQRPLFTQYLFNQYLINPAYTGIHDHFVVSTNYRYQWVGLVDAPRTYSLSVHGPNSGQNYGIGGSMYNDFTGPTSKTGVSLSYAYHLKLNSTQKLSFGLSGGIMQFRIDGTKITVFDQGDLVLTNSKLTTLVPDFGVGAYWYKKDKFYLGISVPQLIQSQVDFTNNNLQTASKLASHFFVNGAYKFSFGDNFSIEPSCIVKYVYPVNPQFDLGLRAFFKDIIWLGGVFRTQDAVSLLLGLNTPDKRFSFGYSYDFTTSNLAKYSHGTHELIIAGRFKSKKKYHAKGKAKLSEFEQLQKKHEAIALENYIKESNKKKVEDSLNVEKEKFNKSSAEEQLKELELKDKALRDQVRIIREEAKSQGFNSPNEEGFAKRNEYLNLLEEIKNNYKKKQEIELKITK